MTEPLFQAPDKNRDKRLFEIGPNLSVVVCVAIIALAVVLCACFGHIRP